ncbi:MAG TPA: helix-turn-helix transcriptional regulator [Polyangiaceae bacterium]|nr:helix-turn-helix transcriptional regulator [Polyangiaceae bacterium]
MPLMRMLVEPALIVHAQTALGTSQEELGKKLGVSRRTMTRWMRKQSYPSPLEWANLARLVYPRNRALAEQIASGLKESLVTLGIEAPPAPPPPPPPPPPGRPYPPSGDLVDSVVCAAAEAIAVTPQSIRPALVAAFDRFASVGLSLDEMRAGLESVTRKGAKRRPESQESPRPQGG